MKKFLCLFLAALICVTCFAGCGKKNTDVTSSGTVSGSDFVKPENYASVVVVTINPQFKLYLDKDNKVLAVEPVNDDAKSIENKVQFENKKVDEVVNNLIVAANDGGFVKTDATIDIKITEVVDEKIDTTAILSTITTSTNTKLTELEITAEIKTAVEIEKKEEVTSSESSTSSEAPACKHEKTKAVSASTGKNVIDSSKLDVISHNKVCSTCNAIVGTEKHTVKNGACTVCGQKNFATAFITLENAGISGGSNGHCGAEINSDGTPDFDYMMQEGYFAIGFETLNKHLNDSGEEWMYEIPESVLYNALKTKFVINDSLFAKLKAQGKYEFFWCDHSYSKGIFYIPYMAAGDVSDYTHKVLGYKDNKNGSFTVYYDYLKGGPDYEEKDRVHQYYYTLEYTYSGASNLTIGVEKEEDYEYQVIRGWKPVVDSLRIKSIKKVTDVSGITAVK